MSALRQLSSYISSWVSAPQATSTTTSNGAPSGLKLEKLIQYPIKSCAGTQVEESEYSIAGLKHDRFWMLVDKESGKMITARTYPKVRSTIESHSLMKLTELSYFMDAVRVVLHHPTETRLRDFPAAHPHPLARRLLDPSDASLRRRARRRHHRLGVHRPGRARRLSPFLALTARALRTHRSARPPHRQVRLAPSHPRRPAIPARDVQQPLAFPHRRVAGVWDG